MADVSVEYPKLGDPLDILLIKLWYKLNGGGSGGGGSGGIVVVQPTVTPHFEDLAATESQVIPAGAKGYGIWVLTGTATVGGKTAVAGMFIGDPNTLAASVTVTMASASTGFVAWNT